MFTCKLQYLPIFPLQRAANPSKFPWIFSPPMPHLNKSVIRWIAVRWLPNKATQIRVNIDSSESAHDSLWWRHVATLTTIHILPSLFWQDGVTEGRVEVGERGRAVQRGLCSVVRAECWLVLQTGAGVASADGLSQPCSTGSRHSPTHQTARRSLTPPAFSQCLYDDPSLRPPILHLVPSLRANKKSFFFFLFWWERD